MKTLQTDFTKGLLWNYISIFFLAAGGIVFSFLIGFYYDATTLGNFNITYAYYVVFSQMGVWGSHMAVTKYTAEYVEDRRIVNMILSSAIFAVMLIAIIFGSFIWVVCNFIIREWIPDSLFASVNAVILAVIFFSINKVILGYLNGLSKMKEYAVLQSIRNVLIAAWIIIFAILDVPGYKITLCFTYTEIVILLIGIPLIVIKENYSIHLSFEWIRKILSFGTRIMPANIVLELSSKVDILCLSWVLKDEATVGIYSFAALFAEGFYQLFVVVRRSINPLITQHYTDKSLEGFYKEVVNRIKKFGYALAILCMAIVIVGYVILCFFVNDFSYYAAVLPLIIMTAAIVCNIKSIIFGNILSQTGNPALESINNIITILSNFALNIVLILKLGMLGAAIATGISYFLFSINQKFIVMSKLNI